jgi:DNA-binding MarR family transcriptional regulator
MTSSDAAPALETATLTVLDWSARMGDSREHARVFEEVVGDALPAADVRMLEYLNGREPVPTSAVASALGIDLSQASRQARRLEQAGYVARVPDPDDGRRTLLHIAPASQPVVDRWLVSWAEQHLAVAAGWSTADLTEMTAWLCHIHRGLNELLPGHPESAAPPRWRKLVDDGSLSAEQLDFGEMATRLYAWAAHAGWFEHILEHHAPALTPLLYVTLRIVDRHGPLSVAELAERTWVDHTQASKRVTKLVELGLVDRAPGAFDRRSSLVRSSRRGSTLVTRIVAGEVAALHDALGPLPDETRSRRTELMQRYVKALIDHHAVTDW